MGLKDSLRKAEEQGRDVTRRVLGQAREQWEDAERRIRAGMRIHPRLTMKSSTAKSSFAIRNPQTRRNSADPALNEDMSKAQAAAAKAGKTSVNNHKEDVA